MDPMEGASTVERMLLRNASQKQIPISGSLELLPLCNMRCDMCYVRLSRAEMEAQGRLRTAEEWLSLGSQMQKAGVLFLLLTGGEPLLYPDFKAVYLGLRSMGMILTINTNATLLDESWADFFAANRPRRINITLYGADEAAYRDLCHYPGGFEKVLNAVRLLRERKIDVKLSSSLTKTNCGDVDRLTAIAEELGVPMRIDTYMMPATRERSLPYAHQSRLTPEDAAKARMHALRLEMKSELFTQFKEKTLWEVEHICPSEGPNRMACWAGSCSFTVNWQGKMRPCVVLSEPEASVFDLGFDGAWKHLKQELAKIELSAECGACNLRPICRTCAASALLETGRFDGTPDYMCRYARESLRLLKEETEHDE